jgi:hypothetical protein
MRGRGEVRHKIQRSDHSGFVFHVTTMKIMLGLAFGSRTNQVPTILKF